MADVVHQFTNPFAQSGGERHRVTAVADQRGHIWIGWLEFSSERDGSVRRTGEETSQPTKEAVAYWARGLEPVYLEGAFNRAKQAC
jgi:hypothetical protein